MRWADPTAVVVALVALVAVAGGSPSVASDRTGQVVRIEKRVSRVLVGAGSFMMGIEPPDQTSQLLDDEVSQETTLLNDCLESFPRGVGLNQQRQPVQFCEYQYQSDLERMHARSVYVDAFLMDRDEVSVADYRRCVASGECSIDALVSGDERYIRADWPMVNVTWEESRIYCAAQGGRLPTEAEWEYAARGNDGRRWPWGEVARPRDWNHGQARTATMRMFEAVGPDIPADLMGDPDDSDGAEILGPAGHYPWGEAANGVRDLAGSVAEWTADAYVSNDLGRGYDVKVRGDWVPLPVINPVREGVGPHVVRGGSWRQPAFLGQTFARDPFNLLYDQNRRFAHIGFRCVRSAR